MLTEVFFLCFCFVSWYGEADNKKKWKVGRFRLNCFHPVTNLFQVLHYNVVQKWKGTCDPISHVTVHLEGNERL